MWTGAHLAVRKSTHLPRGEVYVDSFSPQAARGSFCEGTACSLCSLDHTAHFLIAVWNTGRSCQKQAGTWSGKRALTRASHYPQAANETTSMLEASAVRAWKQTLFLVQEDDRSRVGIVKHFVCFGAANQRLILTSPR